MARPLTTDDIKQINELVEAVNALKTWTLAMDDGLGINPPWQVSIATLAKLLVPFNGATNDLDLNGHDVKALKGFFDTLRLTVNPANVPTEAGAVYYDAVDNCYNVVLPSSEVQTLAYLSEVSDIGIALSNHMGDTENPHEVTQAQVGLGKVANKTEAEMVADGAIKDALALRETVANVNTLKGTDWTDETVKGNAKDIDTLNADATTAGSVAYDIKQLSDALKGVDYTEGTLKTHEDRLDTLEGADTVSGSVAKTVKDTAQDATFTDASGLDSTTLKDAINEIYAEKAVANGLASLDATGKIPVAQLPVSAMEFKGGWDASSGAYPLTPDVGDFWTVSVAGTTEGVKFDAGDAIVYNGATWDKINKVEIAEEVSYDNSSSGLIATNVQDAIDEVEGRIDDAETALTTLNADAETEGSVAKTVKDAVEPIIEDMSDHESRIESLEREVKPLGVLFEGMPSVVTGERTLGASSATFRVNAGVMNTEPYPETDVRFQYPFNEIKTAKINADFTINAWIDEPDFLTSDGIIATQLPAIYVNDDLYDIRISKTPRIGYHLHPLHIDTITGQKRNYVWLGSDKSSKVDGVNKLTCELGKAYYTNVREDTVLRPYSEAVGDGWSQADIALRDYLRILILVAGASHNTQAVFGRGVCDLRYTASDAVTVASTDDNYVIVSDATGALYNEDEWVNLGTAQGNTTVFAQRKIALIEADYDSLGNTRITVDGATFSTTVGNVLWHAPQLISDEDFVAMGNECGYIGTNGRVPVSFFGIWNLWGNIWEWCDGLFHVNLVPYYTYDPSKYSSIGASQPADLTQFTQHPTTMPASSGYCGQFAGTPAVPSTLTSGSDSAGMCDYFYTSTGYKALRVGGALDRGSAGGFFIWHVNYSPANASWAIGSRLLGRP